MNFTLLPSSSVLIQSSSRMSVACACNVRDDRCDLSRLPPRGSWVLDTNVGSKLFVALAFVVLLHFIQGFVEGRTRRPKHPSPESSGPSSIPACVAWAQYTLLTMCKKEQYRGA